MFIALSVNHIFCLISLIDFCSCWFGLLFGIFTVSATGELLLLSGRFRGMAYMQHRRSLLFKLNVDVIFKVLHLKLKAIRHNSATSYKENLRLILSQAFLYLCNNVVQYMRHPRPNGHLRDCHQNQNQSSIYKWN